MKLRVGIVGCGGIIKNHIAALRKIKDVKLVTVCDLNEELAKHTALTYGIDNYYSDFSALLAMEKLDIIHITTPPQTHLLLATTAMESGCHVLVEKPLALTVDDADKMIEVARKNNVHLSVIHNALFLPAITKAKKIIESSAIGELLEMQIIQTIRHTDIIDKTHWCHQLPGGIFGELLPHALYLAEAFLGDVRIVKVNSLKLGTYEWLKADEVRLMLESNKCSASITCSLNIPGIMFINFIGSRGYLHVGVSRGVIIKHKPSEKLFNKGLDNLWTSCQWINATISSSLQHILNQYHDDHYYYIKEYVSALLTGQELPVTVETARKITKLYQEATDLIPSSK